MSLYKYNCSIRGTNHRFSSSNTAANGRRRKRRLIGDLSMLGCLLRSLLIRHFCLVQHLQHHDNVIVGCDDDLVGHSRKAEKKESGPSKAESRSPACLRPFDCSLQGNRVNGQRRRRRQSRLFFLGMNSPVLGETPSRATVAVFHTFSLE